MTESASESEPTKIHVNSAQFRAATIGLFLVSAAMFSTLYCTQGILPQIAQGFGISSGSSQLTVLISTGCLAVGMFPMSLLSERLGRRNIMLASMVSAAIVGLIVPWSQSFTELLVLKGLQGFFLAGVPAIAIAYVSEEFDRAAITRAMGMYVAGAAFGGLIGRMLPLWVAQATLSWRWAMGSATTLTVVFTIVFIVTLPPSYFFTPSTHSYLRSSRLFLSHLANPRLLAIYLFVFCVMGAYVSMYNGLPFHMESPPFDMSPTVYSSLFLVNIVGTLSSRSAGNLSSRIGVRATLLFSVVVLFIGVLPLFASKAWIIILGTALVTAGGFAAHTCATGLVATIAQEGRSQAAALYMASFYGGSAVIGFIGSQVFVHEAWRGLVVYMGALVAVGFALALTIRVPTHGKES